MLDAEDHWLPTNSGEDADVLDDDGKGDMQIAEDQSLSSNCDEDSDILDVDGNGGDMQILREHSLPTNSEKVACSSRRRNRETVRGQVTDPRRESNNGNCISNGQGSTSRRSGRKLWWGGFGLLLLWSESELYFACGYSAITSWIGLSLTDLQWISTMHTTC